MSEQIDLTLDGDQTEIYKDGGATALVVRVSRTASGAMTYTVGASMGMDADVAQVMGKIAELNEATRNLTSDATDEIDRTETLSEQLRQSVLIGRIKAISEDGKLNDGWVEAPMIITEGESRARVIANLQSLVRAGHLEYKQGGGRNKPSMYRVIGKTKRTSKPKAA